MYSTNDGSEQTGSTERPLSIQHIIGMMSQLAVSLQQTTSGTSAAVNNQTGNEQNGSNSGDVSQGNQDGDPEINNGRKEIQQELNKLSRELLYMIDSFKKLATFENDLREPLSTLKANVKDIVADLPLDKEGRSAKQVQRNLRVLRDNIIKVKIQIPLQHQTASTNSGANRPLQTTIATIQAGDLPPLFGANIFKSSYYFREIEEKYRALRAREKLCLFCFSIFPENAEIKKRLLRFWWVGENLVPADDNPEEEKKLVNETLETFLKNGFIQPVRKKNKLQPRSYTMSPIVRSCLIKFAKDKRFFDYDNEGKPTMDFSSCKKACMLKSQGAPVRWFSNYLKGPEPKPGRKNEQASGTKKDPAAGKDRLPADLVKLQMLFNFPKKETLLDASGRFHELQTLFNISKQFPALPKEWFSKMTGINVLYLGRWESSAGRQRHIEVEDTDFFKGFKNMKILRLLSLQGISGITRLPSTICKLQNLRILDVRACHNLEKLPDRIGLLKELTYLDLSECYLLDKMPKQLNKLSKLQVFKGFVISSDVKNSCTLDDLSKLGNLRKLSVNVNATEMEFKIDDAGNALSKFENLEKLKISWASGALKGNNSTQGSREEGKGTIQGKGASKPKKAAPPSTENANKGEDREDNKKSTSGEANSKTMKNKWGRLPTKMSSSVYGKGFKKLVKLELQCFPRSEPPEWLAPGNMPHLMQLGIRGGRLSRLETVKSEEQKWNVEKLRLKFLMDLKMNWIEMLGKFPRLDYLEMARCPRITFCPCNADGVWRKSSDTIIPDQIMP